MLRMSDTVITDTKLHIELIQKLFGISNKKLFDVPVGTDEKVFNLNAARYDIREKKREIRTINDTGQPFIVFYYADLMRLHGFDILLEAVKILQRKNLPIKFIFGAGDTMEYAMAQYKNVYDKEYPGDNEKFKLLGWIDSLEKVLELINNADLCLAGHYGNTGQGLRVISTKVFQYLAMGKATLLGRINMDAGFIDKENCLLVKQGSADDLAQAILWAYNNREKLNSIGLSGHELYEKSFSNAKIAERLKEAIDQAMS